MQAYRVAGERPRSTTYATQEHVDWNRRGLNQRASHSGSHVRHQAMANVVGRGMHGAGYGGLGGLGGRGCDSAGAQAAQSIFGAAGAVLSMFGAAQADAAKPTDQTFTTDSGAKTVTNTNIPTSSTALLAAGGAASAVGSSWSGACEARAAAAANQNPMIDPTLAPALPVPAQQTTWINGVPNVAVVAGGAAVLLGAALLMRR